MPMEILPQSVCGLAAGLPGLFLVIFPEKTVTFLRVHRKLFQPQRKFPGADLVGCLKSPVEAGVIAEAAKLADGRGGLAFAHHLFGCDQPTLGHIPVDRRAGHPGKLPGQVVFAYEEPVCQGVQGKIMLEILVDIFQYIIHNLGYIGSLHFQRFLGGQSAKLGEDQGQVGKAADLVAIFSACLLCQQKLQHVQQLLPNMLVRTEQTCVAGQNSMETGIHWLVRKAELIQKVAVQPQDDPLVVAGLAVENGLVKLHRPDQQNITGSQQITAAFDIVKHTAGKKKVDFVKIMVVQRNILWIGILVAEDLESMGLHLLPVSKSLGFGRHGRYS